MNKIKPFCFGINVVDANVLSTICSVYCVGRGDKMITAQSFFL